jgi:hypothetical protein
VETFVNGKIPLKKIKTTAVLSMQGVDMTIDMGIVPLSSPAGIGFTVAIKHIELDIKTIDIVFLNDTTDTNLASLVIRLIKNSIPNIVNKAVT